MQALSFPPRFHYDCPRLRVSGNIFADGNDEDEKLDDAILGRLKQAIDRINALLDRRFRGKREFSTICQRDIDRSGGLRYDYRSLGGTGFSITWHMPGAGEVTTVYGLENGTMKQTFPDGFSLGEKSLPTHLAEELIELLNDVMPEGMREIRR